MTTTDFSPDSQENEGGAIQPAPSGNIGKIILFSALGVLGFLGFILATLFLLFFVVPSGPEVTLARESRQNSRNITEVSDTDNARINKDMAALEKKVDKLTNQGPYLIVNTTENKFYLYSDNELVREGPCSTGKNEKLIAGKKEFRFKTPRGVHKVLRKQKNPVWAKPDWAFLEEGEPIPPPGDPSRFDEYTLGPFKLEIGDGYMVHGTIWKRFMGQSVTHGCIRMLDDDIEAVYMTLPVGSKVIIY